MKVTVIVEVEAETPERAENYVRNKAYEEIYVKSKNSDIEIADISVIKVNAN